MFLTIEICTVIVRSRTWIKAMLTIRRPRLNISCLNSLIKIIRRLILFSRTTKIKIRIRIRIRIMIRIRINSVWKSECCRRCR